METETFRNLPTAEVARLVRESGTRVCVFPINGTRRWFMLEHRPLADEDPALRYLEVAGQRQIELYQLIFDHGLGVLLSPLFGPDLLARGEDYVRLAAEGMAGLVQRQDFLAFYEAYDVKVCFYGDYRKQFTGTPCAYLLELFDDLTARTAAHHRHHLFYGIFAQDATEAIAERAIQYYREHGRIPDRHTLITMYYGEYVPPVDIFIGFGPFSAFDMPLLALGEEDLYFTISPSPYLSEGQLRDILFDHLYARRADNTDYAAMTPDDWAWMRVFYQANQDRTQGIGAVQRRGGYWYPRPQVQLPSGFETEKDALAGE